MIYLEDANATRQGCSIGIRVESCAEYNDLADTTLDGRRQTVFGEACSHGDEQPEPSPGWLVLRSADGLRKVGGAQDASGEKIGKNVATF